MAMPRTLLALILALTCFSGPARAQARVVPLPDTLGANFPIADSARVNGTATDYDTLLGAWHFTFQQRRPDGTYGSPVTGHWTFRRIPGARPLIADHWRADDPATPFEAGILTYRAFNPQRRRWEVQGNSTNEPEQWQPGIGWSDAGHRYLVQYLAGSIIMRFSYLNIERDRFLWRADRSTDGGATWINDWWVMEVRRVGR
jgi:hypothetical protein